MSVTLFLPSLLESPDEWIDSDWNKEGRKSGMDIAIETRPLLYDHLLHITTFGVESPFLFGSCP
jgi:hypothetical protein